MTLRPGSVRTMSEALLAASVASATAIPMSAFFNAEANRSIWNVSSTKEGGFLTQR